MRPGSDDLDSVLQGSFNMRLLVDVFEDDDPVFPDLPVTDWKLSWDLESDTGFAGDLYIAYDSVFGESLSPESSDDPLAPYGQQVNVLLEVSLGSVFSETLQICRGRITEVPETDETYLEFLGEVRTATSIVHITVEDLLVGVKRWGFQQIEPPAITDSTWDELVRISGLTVNPTLDDRATPVGIAYLPQAGGRLTAVKQLVSYLGGIAYTNSFGELSAIPFTPGPTVLTLRMDQTSRVLSKSSTMTSDGLVNAIVGNYQATDGTPIVSVARIAAGPLDVDGPYGEYTDYDSDDSITTQTAADNRTTSLLKQSMNAQTIRVTLTCILDPRAEAGDVVTVVNQAGKTITGRLVSYSWGSDGQMTVALDVKRHVGS